MLSREELLKMREMTFEDIDPKEIQDVEKLKIDVKKSKPEKVREILKIAQEPVSLDHHKDWVCFYQPYHRGSHAKPCADEMVKPRQG